MKTSKISVTLLLLLTLLIAGCNWIPASDAQNNLPTPTGEIEQTLDTPQEDILQTTPTTSNTNQQILINKVKADLAQHLSISESEINSVTTIEVVWPDTSLGCPQKDVLYTQVLTEGLLIRLEVNNILYQYHTDSNEQFVLCENPGFPLIPVTPGDIDDGIPWVPVN